MVMAWVSVPAFIPSDSPDSPAKDKEGEGGRELCPCAVTLHRDPSREGTKEQLPWEPPVRAVG